MATKNKKADNKQLPANKQKGKKICTCCHKEKNMTDFYLSYSPMYSLDQRVPICKECCKSSCLNDDGSIDFEKFKDLLRNIDKPLYYDLVSSAENSVKKENSYLSEEDLKYKGYDILSKYFTLVAMRQDRQKSYSDSEKEGFMHTNNNRGLSEKNNIINKVYNKSVVMDDEVPIRVNKDDFYVTEDMIALFGEGYTKSEYQKMYDKYEKLKLNYTLQTSLHQEALATYVRFKVKEEDATARGKIDEAKKWYDAAQSAADKAKLSPKQLTKADFQKGLNSFSEISQALEQAVDIIEILPRFKNQPSDSVDFNIWCYINYARKLKGLPTVDYKDVYKFYDDMKSEYISQYGDPYGIFDDDTTIKNRENVEKFIKLPSDYDVDSPGDDEE